MRKNRHIMLHMALLWILLAISACLGLYLTHEESSMQDIEQTVFFLSCAGIVLYHYAHPETQQLIEHCQAKLRGQRSGGETSPG